MKIKNIKLPGKLNHPLLVSLLQSRLGVIGSNWILQGLRYMNLKERLHRLAFELILFLIMVFAFKALNLSCSNTLLAAFFITHTIFWSLNGQLFVLARYISNHTFDHTKFLDFVKNHAERISSKNYIESAVAFGSLARGEWSNTSDFDVRLVSKPGLINWIRTLNFCVIERTRALFAAFPLDIYVFEMHDFAAKVSTKEQAILLHDPNNRFQYYPAGCISLENILNE